MSDVGDDEENEQRPTIELFVKVCFLTELQIKLGVCFRKSDVLHCSFWAVVKYGMRNISNG